MRAPAVKSLTPVGVVGVVVVTLLLGWAPGVVTSASAGDILACATKFGGFLRVPQRGQCLDGETPVSLTSQGLSGVVVVDWSSKPGPEPLKRAFAKCPTGKHVIAGGAKVWSLGLQVDDTGLRGQPGQAPIALKASFASQDKTGWAATAEAVGETGDWYLTAYAACADGR